MNKELCISASSLYKAAVDGGREDRWTCDIIMHRFRQNSKNSLLARLMVFICFLPSPLRATLQVLVAFTPGVISIAATSLTCEGLMWGRRRKGVSPFHCPVSKEANNAFQHRPLMHFRTGQLLHL